MSTSCRTILIIAGANGVGKSSAYEAFKNTNSKYNKFTFINPDVLAKQAAQKLGYGSVNNLPINTQNVINIQASKLALKMRQDSFNKGISFGIETTASSESILKLIDKAHKLDYTVEIIYVLLDSPKLHIQRVKQRVSKGGHFVSEKDIMRRYQRSRELLPRIMKKADSMIIYNNSSRYKPILKKENGKIEKIEYNKDNDALVQSIIRAYNETESK